MMKNVTYGHLLSETNEMAEFCDFFELQVILCLTHDMDVEIQCPTEQTMQNAGQSVAYTMTLLKLKLSRQKHLKKIKYIREYLISSTNIGLLKRPSPELAVFVHFQNWQKITIFEDSYGPI